MKYLLDTCTFLWIADASDELSKRARDVFLDPRNERYLSVVSVWEIALKHAAKKLRLPKPPDRFIPIARDRAGIGSLELDDRSIFRLSALPDIHPDPFDRMLVCQAQVEGMVILTPDPKIRRYPIATEW